MRRKRESSTASSLRTIHLLWSSSRIYWGCCNRFGPCVHKINEPFDRRRGRYPRIISLGTIEKYDTRVRSNETAAIDPTAQWVKSMNYTTKGRDSCPASSIRTINLCWSSSQIWFASPVHEINGPIDRKRQRSPRIVSRHHRFGAILKLDPLRLLQ